MRKPAVEIVKYIERDINEIVYGIEEEGIPSEQVEKSCVSEAMQTYVRVAVYVDKILVFFDKYSLEKPYIRYSPGDSLRIIGANCARLIKGSPLL